MLRGWRGGVGWRSWRGEKGDGVGDLAVELNEKNEERVS